MNKLNIQSIFHSLDGEANAFDGAGQLCTFIRLKGCNLQCSFCDTSYSQSSTPENWMTIDEIVEQVVFPKVTITGGEPLLQKEGVKELCEKLWTTNHDISIETNGTIPMLHMDCRDSTFPIRVVMDYKLPSSGMEHKMNLEAFVWLEEKDMIKFVISDWNDYNRALEVIKEHPEWEAKKVFSPAIKFDTLYDHTYTFICHFDPSKAEEVSVVDLTNPRQLAEKMIEDRVPAQFSLQIHKLLWPGSTEER